MKQTEMSYRPPTLIELQDRKRAYLDAIYRRELPPIRMMDAGTREGRRGQIAMARRALREARQAFELGDYAEALDALAWALKLKTVIIPHYLRTRRAILADDRYNVGGTRPW